MSSPFPGMNPYLENPAVWHDFHGVFVTLMRLDLARQLRGRYQVRMDENIYVHELDAEQRRLLGRADAHVASPGSERVESTMAVTLTAPVQGTLPVGVDLLRERFIEIRDGQDQRVVTVVELLNPTNKRPGPDREQYLSKRRQYLSSEVNLVEIDLLRRGERMPMEGLPDCAYCVLVSPGDSRPSAGLWPIQVTDALPKIPVPLAGNDEAAELNLHALFQQAFNDAGYGDELYASAPILVLPKDLARWAEGLAGA